MYVTHEKCSSPELNDTRLILQESIAKEREDRKEPLGENEAVMGDETSLFYSDIMPLLVSMSKKLLITSVLWSICSKQTSIGYPGE